MIDADSESKIMIVPASCPSRESAASTRSEPIPGSEYTVSTTAAPPIAETRDCEINDRSTGSAGFIALFTARSFFLMPIDSAKSEYWLSTPSIRAFLKTLI